MTTSELDDDLANELANYWYQDHKYTANGRWEECKEQADAALLTLKKKWQNEAVDAELTRLSEALAIMGLCEADLDTLLIWVKNAKWSLVAPHGTNTELTAQGGKDAN